MNGGFELPDGRALFCLGQFLQPWLTVFIDHQLLIVWIARVHLPGGFCEPCPEPRHKRWCGRRPFEFPAIVRDQRCACFPREELLPRVGILLRPSNTDIAGFEFRRKMHTDAHFKVAAAQHAFALVHPVDNAEPAFRRKRQVNRIREPVAASLLVLQEIAHRARQGLIL